MQFTHQHFAQIDSTNDACTEAARAGAAAGLVIRATMQTGGRGRQGRVWHSPPGNLYASLLLRPPGGPAVYGQVSFIIALALGAVVQAQGISWALKWPNDVLVNGAKISGILLESGPDWLVVGTGFNITSAPSLPDKATTCLAAHLANPPAPEQALQLYLDAFAGLYSQWQEQGFAPIRAQWLARAHGVGAPLEVVLASGEKRQGIFDALDTDGALLLRCADAAPVRILSGDVFFR